MSESDRATLPTLDRRRFLALAGLALTAGCASQRKAMLPPGDCVVECSLPPTPALSQTIAESAPAPLFAGIRPRNAWAKAPPDPSIMDPMLPIRYLTVHHDGLDRLCVGQSYEEMAARIELYRVGHCARGWGDIGYHFVIDRSGALWQGRDLRWQGAHVKDRNEGNIGVLVMGNFELERPSEVQLAAMRTHLRALCAYYTIPWSRVLSHREWPGARTACPGRHLQEPFAALRTTELRIA
jgi:hypothetical protein